MKAIKYRVYIIDRNGVPRISHPICANSLERFLSRITPIIQSYSIGYYFEYPL